MKILEIYNFLDKLSPFELQEKWDNSGLLVGSFNDDVKQIALSLDVDEKLLKSLKPNTLLITHHPVIFSGVKRVDFDTYPSNLLKIMVEKNISNIAMHTNFDKTHLNRFVATEVLGYKIADEEDFIIYFDVDLKFNDFLKIVSKKFNLKQTKCVKSNKKVRRVALTTGSGASLIPHVKADCFLTGDIKYHDAMQAKSLKLSMIEIGHYESEQFFAKILQKHLKNLGLKVIIAQSKNPFKYGHI